MSLQLLTFPVVPLRGRVHFQDSFAALRRHSGLAHEAIDIGAERGTPIVSATGGLIVTQWVTKKTRQPATGCGWSQAGGNIVIVLDSNGYAHYYAHMDAAPSVTSGTRIAQGARLGQVGNTGDIASGSSTHLHYQVWAVGSHREAESAAGIFTRPFGRAVNPYQELARLARTLGAAIGRNGGVTLTPRQPA